VYKLHNAAEFLESVYCGWGIVTIPLLSMLLWSAGKTFLAIQLMRVLLANTRGEYGKGFDLLALVPTSTSN
jgi:hypothetical protein